MKNFLWLLLIISCLYLGVASNIYWWKHPEKTQMQVTQHTLKTLVLNFND